jgi:hypothetical protein
MVCKLRNRIRLVRNTSAVAGRYLLKDLGDCPAAEVYVEGKTVYQWTGHFCDPLQRDVAPQDDVPKADVVEVREGAENKCPRHAEYIRGGDVVLATVCGYCCVVLDLKSTALRGYLVMGEVRRKWGEVTWLEVAQFRFPEGRGSRFVLVLDIRDIVPERGRCTQG